MKFSSTLPWTICIDWRKRADPTPRVRRSGSGSASPRRALQWARTAPPATAANGRSTPAVPAAPVGPASSCRAGPNPIRTFRSYPGARYGCTVTSQRQTRGRRPAPGDMTRSRKRRFCDAQTRSSVLVTPGVAKSGLSGGPMRREKPGTRRDDPTGTRCAFRLFVKLIKAITAGRIRHRALASDRVNDHPVFIPERFGVKRYSCATGEVPGVAANRSTRESRFCLFCAHTTAVGHLPSRESFPPLLLMHSNLIRS